MVKHEVAYKLDSYEKVTKQFQKYFNTEELQSTLEGKADLRMIESLRQTKAQKSDVTEVQNLLSALNVRLKHVSILMAEMAKAVVPIKASSSMKGGENINTKLLRRDFVCRQAEILSRWINDTDLRSNIKPGKTAQPPVTKNINTKVNV